MPPKHTAQTSTEAKKAFRKNGPAISERTHKQLQRGYELEQRAAREREAEQRRKLAKEKRNEREKKEDQIRKQIGVGLATQLIGYSHTQANLKRGMEAFLGLNKKKQDEERRRKEEEKRREEDLARKLEIIAQDLEKEPFDHDDDMNDAMMDLPVAHAQDNGGWADDELDDDTLLEVHDLAVSDPIEEPVHEAISEVQQALVIQPAQNVQPYSPKSNLPKEVVEFTRTHGPLNKTVESTLRRLPGDIIELLSQDTAAMSSGWDPAHGLLYKLNPVGLPPHRLRVKVGCVVICLRDLDTSSQLSKSQHVRILRVETERLECLTLDGPLAGTKTVITRVPFSARYRNDDNFPFTRIQYPVRVAIDYASTDPPQDIQLSGFKMPTMKGTVRPPTVMKRLTPPANKSKSQVIPNPSFKLPGLPASKVRASTSPKPAAPIPIAVPMFVAFDGWDDFLESSTQIARELSADTAQSRSMLEPTDRPSYAPELVPPVSTQDLDFSLDDLDDEPLERPACLPDPKANAEVSPEAVVPVVKAAMPGRSTKSPPSVKPGPLSRTANIRRIAPEPPHITPPAGRPQKSLQSKVKRPMASPLKPLPPAKKSCIAPPTLPMVTTTTAALRRISDFGMSTQEASSFFDDDDDDMAFGSPPIAV